MVDGGDDAASRAGLAVIPENLQAVLGRAKRDGTDMARAAEAIALSLVAAGDDAKHPG